MIDMKTVIWDYNGTILDDVYTDYCIVNEILRRRELPQLETVEDYRNQYQPDMYQFYDSLGIHTDEESYLNLVQEYNALLDEYSQELRLQPGVIELLEANLQKGYRNIILSSCNQEILERQCDSLDITKYFETIIGLEDYLVGSKVERGKQWMKEQHITGDRCVMIGDTVVDAETAKQLGIQDVWLVNRGHQSYEKLRVICLQVVYRLSEIIL